MSQWKPNVLSSNHGKGKRDAGADVSVAELSNPKKKKEMRVLAGVMLRAKKPGAAAKRTRQK